MLAGIFPPLSTPFVDQRVAYDHLSDTVLRLNSTELSGYVALGSNGESAYLSRQEKLDIIRTIKQGCAEGKRLIAGTGSDSIQETIALSNEAAAVGADCVLVLTPSFYKGGMGHKALIDYFTNVADQVDVPLIIYNVPKFTGVDIEPATVAVLSQHDNIVGIKSSVENIAHLSQLVSKSESEFSVLAGTASVLYPAFCVGAVGGVVALANIAPEQCVQIHRFYQSGQHQEALQLQNQLIDANHAITSKYGVAGLKKALQLLGYYGGDPRLPLQPFANENLAELKQILTIAKILPSAA